MSLLYNVVAKIKKGGQKMPLKTKCEIYIVEYNITEKNLADLPMFGIAVKCGNKLKEINNVFFT